MAERRALVIAHDPASTAALVGKRLEHHGFVLDQLTLTESLGNPTSSVPFGDPTEFDLIVPMGSVWSVYDESSIGSWIGRELGFLSAAVDADVPVLGICFGGQALAAATGGTVMKSAEPQVGWCMIDSTEPELASGPWMEWHYDRLEAPADAVVVAKDADYTQAFTIGRSLGLQFHPEVTPEHLSVWLDGAGRAELAKVGLDADELLAETARNQAVAVPNTNRLVDWFLADVARLD